MPIFTVGAAGTVSTSSYEVANSLRFETGSSKSLSVNASTSASTRTFTYSFWTKRATNPSDQEDYLGAGGSADQNHIQLRNDHVRVRHYASGHTFDVETDGELRDPSAWYHIVVAIDTTQATDTNRLKIYINGVQQTSFTTSSYPPQNFDFDFLQNGTTTYIGRRGHSDAYELDCYLSEVVFIDGTQLDATSFGEFDSASGIWKPIDVSELTFGNAGFYLKFDNGFDKHTLTANGNVKHSTAQSKIGGSSIYFDGTDDWITVTDHPNFDFGTGAFTIEMWVRMDSSSTDYTGLFTMDNPQCSFRINAQGRIQFLQDHGGTRGNTDDADTSGTNLRDNAWHHVAVVRESDNSWDLYVDGTSEYSGTGMTGNITGLSDIVIGRRADSDSYYLTGYLDEIRVSKVARYTSNFTPSTTAFNDDNNTILLIHSDTTNNSTTFTDSSGAVSSLGNDASGNGNHFTVNNMTNVDQSIDTCTNNYNVLNPLTNNEMTFTEGNLKTVRGGTAGEFCTGTFQMNSGKWYFESKLLNYSGNSRPTMGIAQSENSFSGTLASHSVGTKAYYLLETSYYQSNSATAITGINTSPATNDIYMWAFDLDNLKFYIGKNGTWYHSSDPSAGSNGLTIESAGYYSIATGPNDNGTDTSRNNEWIFNFGAPAYLISSGNSDGNGHGNFEYTVPTGFYAINSKNLKDFG